jgi:hypothetical protein
MSISAATRAVRARQNEADQPGGNLASQDDAGGVIGRLTAFLPAEMITIWGVVLTLIAPNQDLVRWLALAVGAVVLVILMQLDLALKDKEAREKNQDAKPVSARRRVRTFGVATVSFVAWALATPGTPLDGDQGKFAVGVAVVLTAIITRCAKLWDIEPQSAA